MKNLLLLILSLMTGCVASSKVKGCQGGQVIFSCKCLEQATQNQTEIQLCRAKSLKDKCQHISTQKKDMWEDNSKYTFFYNTKEKNLIVIIRHLKEVDEAYYWCGFNQQQNSPSHVELDVDDDDCQNFFFQTAYQSARTTITCKNLTDLKARFFCRENGSRCEDILPTKSTQPKGRFSLSFNKSSFNLSISNLTEGDSGFYHCGGERRSEERNRDTLKKVYLQVNGITTFKRSWSVGDDHSYWCTYSNSPPIKRFICKGDDPFTCQRVVSTNGNSTRFFMKDDRKAQNITIWIRELSLNDSGTYWCGAESTDRQRSNPFFNRFLLTVVSPSPSSLPSLTTTVPTTTSVFSNSSEDSPDGPQQHVLIIVALCVAVLLLLVLVFICKRFLPSKNAVAGNTEQGLHDYEEVKELNQKPQSGTALTTIYVTANHPTNPSAFHQYETVGHLKVSEVSGGTLFPKSSSSDCEYSTVGSPTYSTVNHPSRSCEDPLYSSVKKPQKPSAKLSVQT